MAVGCGAKTAKFILFVFNVLFWISGLILIIVGSVYLANGTFKYIDEVINTSTNRNILIGFVVLGVIVTIIGFCGCCGAMKENRFLLGMYIVLVIIIIIAEVAVGIAGIVMKDSVQNKIEKNMYKVIKNNYSDSGDITIKTAIDELQRGFKCCGVFNYTDWSSSQWHKNNTDKKVPDSCCKNSTMCGKDMKTGSYYSDGCVPKIEDYIKKYFPIVIGIVLGIAFFEIFVVICAFCLCRNTDHEHQSV